MRHKAFDCVEMKRQAQERIHAETSGLSVNEKIAYYNRLGDEARKRQAELQSAIRNVPEPAGH